MMSDIVTTAIFSFAIAFVVSLSYPASILFCLPKSTKPTRWIQNNPSYSIFLLSSFPAAVCIFSITVKAGVISYWLAPGTWRFWMTCGAALLTLGMVSLIVIDDFTSKPFAPYILKPKEAEQSSKLEWELREAARTRARPKNLENKRKQYQKLVQLNSIGEVLKRGGPVAYVHLGLAWITTLFVLSYFWYLVFLVIQTSQRGTTVPEAETERLIVIFVLLMSWFPMRLHTEWYQNHFHRKHWLRRYSAFWMLAFLAFAYLLLVILILRPKGVIVLILVALMEALLATIGKFKPEWLRSLADLLASLPFVYFVAMYLVFFVIVGAITSTIWFAN
jgi:hypothetical protein